MVEGGVGKQLPLGQIPLTTLFCTAYQPRTALSMDVYSLTRFPVKWNVILWKRMLFFSLDIYHKNILGSYGFIWNFVTKNMWKFIFLLYKYLCSGLSFASCLESQKHLPFGYLQQNVFLPLAWDTVLVPPRREIHQLSFVSFHLSWSTPVCLRDFTHHLLSPQSWILCVAWLW